MFEHNESPLQYRHPLGQATYLQKVNKKCSQIDYTFVSKRFSSNVERCNVTWAPSIHRFGERFDYGMVQASYKFIIARKEKRERTTIPSYITLKGEAVATSLYTHILTKLTSG